VSEVDRLGPAARERMRRIAQTWQLLEPSVADVAAARARGLARVGRRKRMRAMPGTLAIAIVLAGSAAFAGAGVVWRKVVAPVTSSATTASPNVAPPAARTGSARPPRPVEPPPVVVDEPITVNVNDLPTATVSPTPSHPPASSESSLGASASSAATPVAWSEAADAMRARDYPRAERAFDELARTGNPRARDEARLARAQVWIAEGRLADARPELASLAATGVTSLVRQRAADALRAMP
jgi:hypothetical protein